MRNNIYVRLILITVCLVLCGYFGPWWGPAGAMVILAGLMGLTVRQGILYGGIVMGLIYKTIAVWQWSKDASGLLEKTGLMLGGLSPLMLIVVTTLIGAVTGVLAGWLGSVLGKVVTTR